MGPARPTSAPRIVPGDWTGQVTASDQSGAPVEPVTLSAVATSGEEGTYDITGWLAFRGLTHNVTGSGEGDWGATLRPPSGKRPPTQYWELMPFREGEDGVAAGDMLAAGTPEGLSRQTSMLNMYSDVMATLEGTLTRENGK